MTKLPISEVLCRTVEFQALTHGCKSECQSKQARRHPFDCRKFAKSDVNEARFWAKVERDGPLPAECPELGRCWIWKGAKNRRGYGSFVVNGGSILAHRVAVVLAGREFPAGMVADHQCHNPSCVNPAHIKTVTVLQNGQNTAQYRKTHCIRGHARTPENVRVTRQGSRQCRACRRVVRMAPAGTETPSHPITDGRAA